MAFKFIVLATILAVANAGGLLGVPGAIAGPGLAYSAAPAVSHVSYSSPIVSYGGGLGYGGALGYGGSLGAQLPAVTSQSANILRSFGNLGQVSTYSKTIDTPFSSVSKSDVRVSNPGLAVRAPYGYAPVQASYAAPIHAGYGAQIAAPAAIGVAYSAAPAVSHVTYTGLGANYGW